LLKRLRIVFARGLGLTPRSKHPPVLFRQHDGGLSVCVCGHDAAISYDVPGISADNLFAVPFHLLKRCEGTKDEQLTLRCEGEEVVAEWTDAGIPQVARFGLETVVELPPLPTTMQPNQPELLPALRDAVETADSLATRYALNCLRLRGGSNGQVAATDGQQLLVQSGFTFPWDGDVLIPACRVLACADIQSSEPCEIGQTDEWVTLHSGVWAIQLRIETESRFPRVDDRIPQSGSAKSTLHLSDADAQFFTKSVKALPANGEHNAPVTVDLNGAVTIRAKGTDQPTPTEIVLNGSRRDGVATRFNTNRNYLKRAMQLGFRSIDLFDPEAPVCCRDQRRSYVWALLGKDGAVKPDTAAVRIESPAGTPASPTSPPQSRRSSNSMSQRNQSNGHSNSDGAANDETNSTTSLIEQAETLKNSLQESLSQTRELIAALKKQKKQSRLVQSTLASLRQLQTSDV